MTSMEDNGTIEYYDRHAKEYFQNTVQADMSETCDRFLKYVKAGGKIVDLGAGSGRDIAYFKDKGFQVEGIDASDEMCRLASKYTGIDIQCQKIQDWNPSEIYNGIWANASLLHITPEEFENFLLRVESYLSDFGVLYVSMKSGIITGRDPDGRYFAGFTLEKVQQMVEKDSMFHILECWTTEDSLKRKDFKWINVILRKQ